MLGCQKFAKQARIAARAYYPDCIDLFLDCHGLHFFAPRHTSRERRAFRDFVHVDDSIVNTLLDDGDASIHQNVYPTQPTIPTIET